MPRARSEKGGVDLRSLPYIFFRGLGREKADGQSWHPQHSEVIPVRHAQIEIDPDQHNRSRLETIIHEAMHICVPGMHEDTVLYTARYIARVVWAMKYRADEDKQLELFPYDPEKDPRNAYKKM